MSNEEFFKNLNIENTISNLKLRVGWGQNGNQRIDRDAPLTLIGTNNENQWYFGNGYSQGYVPTYVGNADIKLEIVFSMFRFLKNSSLLTLQPNETDGK